MTERKTVEIYAEIKRRTAKAVLISEGDGEPEVWLPLSMIEIDMIPDNENYASITLPEWLAKDKGLI